MPDDVAPVYIVLGHKRIEDVLLAFVIPLSFHCHIGWLSLRHLKFSSVSKMKVKRVLRLKKVEHNPAVVYFREQVLEPHTRHFITVKFKEGLQGGDCNFEVTNFVVAPDKGLRYTIKL